MLKSKLLSICKNASVSIIQTFNKNIEIVKIVKMNDS